MNSPRPTLLLTAVLVTAMTAGLLSACSGEADNGDTANTVAVIQGESFVTATTASGTAAPADGGVEEIPYAEVALVKPATGTTPAADSSNGDEADSDATEDPTAPSDLTADAGANTATDNGSESTGISPPDTAASPAAGTLPGGAGHNAYQALPRAYESDVIDEATGVPVLQRDDGDLLVVNFGDLGFPEYMPPDPPEEGEDPAPPAEFPERLLAFQGRRLTIDGFMIPTSFRDGKVREFILSGDPPYCCFGGFPPIDRAIDVYLPEDHPGVDYSSYGVMRIVGTLEIGENFDDYGYVLGIYKMTAEFASEEF